jgi:hypothetical protein
MSKSKILALISLVGIIVSPAAFSFGTTADTNGTSFRVLGEKVDSGLGSLASSYTAAEFQRARVAGESLDSGLGDLSPSYTAAEFERVHVAGESLDSGLGDLPPSYTAAEFQSNTQVVAAR